MILFTTYKDIWAHNNSNCIKLKNQIYIAYSFILLLFFSSSSQIAEDELKHLNGYWEIQEVKFTDGSTKTYDISTTIDYIEFDVNTKKGFRKKVQPNLTGTYQTSDHAEFFEIIKKENQWFLVYKTAYETWEESLIKLHEDAFSVKNKEQITYKYKRFEAFELE